MALPVEDIEVFSFPVWYPLYQKDAGEAFILSLPDFVLEYLIGSSREGSSASSDDDDFNYEWSDEEDFFISEPPKFTCFNKNLKNAINYVGGAAFVKTNWHCAKDGPWASSSFKCTNVSDVFVLLKSSESIRKDLTYTFKSNRCLTKHCVVMKKWLNIPAGSEYRCFIKDKSLIAISQREVGQFFLHINCNKFIIMRKVINFFQEKIKNTFPATHYVVDLVMMNWDTIFIVDFQPLTEETADLSLFKWEELCQWIPRTCATSTDTPEFRFIGLA